MATLECSLRVPSDTVRFCLEAWYWTMDLLITGALTGAQGSPA